MLPELLVGSRLFLPAPGGPLLKPPRTLRAVDMSGVAFAPPDTFECALVLRSLSTLFSVLSASVSAMAFICFISQMVFIFSISSIVFASRIKDSPESSRSECLRSRVRSKLPFLISLWSASPRPSQSLSPSSSRTDSVANRALCRRDFEALRWTSRVDAARSVLSAGAPFSEGGTISKRIALGRLGVLIASYIALASLGTLPSTPTTFAPSNSSSTNWHDLSISPPWLCLTIRMTSTMPFWCLADLLHWMPRERLSRKTSCTIFPCLRFTPTPRLEGRSL
mmetsp:Transcript_15321/g.44505  ORF Transcript_15321/g.44505 Transcript_15321/m.44505 type:complete len:280 (-) Transcript_15321:509-1348(-)